MNLNDPHIQSRTARSMLDSADENLTGSFDAPDYGALRVMVRKAMGLGEEAVKYVKTDDLLKAGQRAKPDDLTQDQADELAGVAGKLADDVDTPDPTDAAQSPLQASDGDTLDAQGNVIPSSEQPEMQSGNLPDPIDMPEGEQLSAEMVAKQQEEAERRTWERNVNLDYVNSTRDIGAVLDTVAEYLPTVERETLAEVEAGADYKGLQQFLTERPSGNLNSRQLVAGRNMLVTMTEQVNDLANRIAAGDNRTENIAQFEKLTSQTAMLQQFMQGQIRETARALNSMRVVARAVNSSDVEVISRTLGKDAQETALQKARYIQEMNAQGLDEAQVIREMGGFSAANTLASIINLRTAGLLTGFRTHLVNAVSNAGMGAYNNMLVYPMAAMISPVRQGVRRAFGKETRGGVSRQELYARNAVFMRGIRDALAMGVRVFDEGVDSGEFVSSFEGRRKIDEAIENTGLISDATGVTKASKSDNPVVASIAGVTRRGMDTYQRTVEAFSYGGLSASDEFFKSAAYQQAMTGNAMRQALAEGLEGDDAMLRANELLTNPTKKMHDDAMLEAERQTFTDNVSGGIIGNLNSIARDMVTRLPMMRIVAPFINTPTSLVNRAYQNSPAALLSKEFRERITAGGADADLALAQLATGSTIMMAAYMLHDDGTITGKGPEDRSQLEALKATGWQQRSVKVGDKYFSYDRMDPFGMTIGTIADVLDEAAYAEREATAGELVGAVTLGIAEQTVDSTWMKGLSDLMLMVTSYKDPTRYASDVIASMIPSAVPQLSRVTRNPDEGIPSKFYPNEFWAELSEAVESRLPGNTSPPRRFWNGEIIAPHNGEKLWFYYNNMSPIPMSQLTGDKGSAELTNNGVNVTPPKPIVYLGNGVRLDLINDLENGEEIYDRMLRFVGEERAKTVDRAIETMSYIEGEVGPDRGPGSRFDILTNAVRKGRTNGMKKFQRWAQSRQFPENKYGPMGKYLNEIQLDVLLQLAEFGALQGEQLEQAQTMKVPGTGTREGLPVPEDTSTPMFRE